MKAEKIYETEHTISFLDINPRSRGHSLVIPKKHITSILEAEAVDGDLLTSIIMAVQKVAKSMDLDSRGFYLRLNAAAPGVTPHMHWHIIGPGIP